MDDLLKSYGKEIKGMKRGDRIDGVVVSISPKKVVIDFGGKSEGIVAEKAYQNAKEYISTLKVGDKVKPGVIVSEAKDGTVILSLRNAAYDITWGRLEDAAKNDAALRVVGKSLNPAGLMVEIGNLMGFVPLSQLGKESSQNPQSLVQKHFQVKVIQVSRDDNKIVLSERAVADAEDIKLVAQAIEKLKVGDIYAGSVVTITTFGCFVTVPVEIDKKQTVNVEGLVHISEISWKKVVSAKEVVSVGGAVTVKVLGKDGGKVSLSMKQAKDDPWVEAMKKYKKDDKVSGTVAKMTEFGLFVILEEGVEGLVHLTKIPPGAKYERGDDINVYIEEIDASKKKMSLGLVLTTKPVGYR